MPLKLTGTVFPVDELVEMVRVPDAAPAVVGLNCTLSERDWPGCNLAGNVPPETENPAPWIETELISSGHVPTEFKVSDCVEAVLVGTLPNARLLALMLMVDTEAAVPVPLRLTATVFPADELVESVNAPDTAPAAVGLNCTLRASDWPGCNLAGNVAPETEKPAPCTEAE